MHLYKVEPKSTAVMFYNNIKQDPTILASLKNFIDSHSKSMIQYPLLFIGVLECMHNLKPGKEIISLVFNDLAKEKDVCQWLRKTDELIFKYIYKRERIHVYTEKELMEKIVRLDPNLTLYPN